MTGPYLVQVRDANGFWCNVGEYPNWNAACNAARWEARERGEQVRAVAGPKRDAVKYFPAAGEDDQ